MDVSKSRFNGLEHNMRHLPMCPPVDEIKAAVAGTFVDYKPSTLRSVLHNSEQAGTGEHPANACWPTGS